MKRQAMTTPLKAVLAGSLALGLAACAEEAPKQYEVDAVDKSGGELIVTEPNPDEVPVTLPETPMKNVPETELAPGEIPMQ